MRRFGIALTCIAALVLAGFAGALLSGHLKSGSAATTTTAKAAPSTTTSTVVHSSVKVVVANGTQEANAAGHFTQQLAQQGWAVGTPVNATATASATTIYYATGQQAAAGLIASELGVPATAIQPLTASTPIAATTGDDVVVVIGPDLAGQGFPATTVPS